MKPKLLEAHKLQQQKKKPKGKLEEPERNHGLISYDSFNKGGIFSSVMIVAALQLKT